MSRSVSIPIRRSSSPQIGSDPTSSCAIFSAAALTDSFSPMHSAREVITSRIAFLLISKASLSHQMLGGTGGA
jgi:hypothetical protein